MVLPPKKPKRLTTSVIVLVQGETARVFDDPDKAIQAAKRVNGKLFYGTVRLGKPYIPREK